MPPELIAVIHYRESSADYLRGKFDVYLHNGDPLGQKTVHVPHNKNFKHGEFDKAAIDAINGQRHYVNLYQLSSNSKDIVAMMSFAENYNGTGYAKNHHINPYLFSGTNVYKKGKYKSDGNYDPNLVDDQAGVYILLKAII